MAFTAIFVNTVIPVAKTITIVVQVSDTIKKVKNKIQEKCGVQENKQYLTYRGEELQDDDTLEDYDISNLSTIHFDLRYDTSEKEIQDDKGMEINLCSYIALDSRQGEC